MNKIQEKSDRGIQMEEESRVDKKQRRKYKTAEMFIGKRYNSTVKALPFATSGTTRRGKQSQSPRDGRFLVETITNEMLSTKGLSALLHN